MPVGRPPKFDSPEALQQTFLDWKEEFKPGGLYEGEIPDVECFCDYVDAYRDLLHEYSTKPDYSDTVKRIKNWIYYKKKQLAMKNQMNATIFIFDAKNNAGYVDKTEQDLTSAGEKLEPTIVQFIDKVVPGGDNSDTN
jgi:hypothetical protein